MREKQLRVILTFHTTTDAIAMEKHCVAKGVAGRLIPLPTIISAGCGMCWSAPADTKRSVLLASEAAGIEAAGVYELMI